MALPSSLFPPRSSTTLPIVKFIVVVVVDLLFSRRHWSIRICLLRTCKGPVIFSFFYLVFSFSFLSFFPDKLNKMENGLRVYMWATLGGGKKKNMKVRPGISRLPPCFLEYFVPLLCLVKGDVIKKGGKTKKSFSWYRPKDFDPLVCPQQPQNSTRGKREKKKFQTKKKRDFLIKNISCCVNQTENKGGANRGIDDLI